MFKAMILFGALFASVNVSAEMISNPLLGGFEGDITKAQAEQLAQKAFSLIDTNQDGVLSVAEKEVMLERVQMVMSAQGKTLPKIPKPQKATSKKQFMALQETIFKRLDRNGDGVIRQAERDELKRQFKQSQPKVASESVGI